MIAFLCYNKGNQGAFMTSYEMQAEIQRKQIISLIKVILKWVALPMFTLAIIVVIGAVIADEFKTPWTYDDRGNVIEDNVAPVNQFKQKKESSPVQEQKSVEWI